MLLHCYKGISSLKTSIWEHSARYEKAGRVPRYHFGTFYWLNQALKNCNHVILVHDLEFEEETYSEEYIAFPP